ncbi:MAG TPA: hypothetical protein VFM09_05650 [Marmoricola sp.]|nr:hypothetical protein [Marmoricola sp.]
MDILAMPSTEQTRETIDRFLERNHAMVVDVLPGATSSSRRLLVGRRPGGPLTHAVAVGTDGTDQPLATEERALRAVPALPPELARTLPRVVERVRVDARHDGLVLTAVPGLSRQAPGSPEVRPGQLLVQVSDWLGLLWRGTAGPEGSAALAVQSLPAFLERYDDSARLRSALVHLRAARDRLGQFEVQRTLRHGCLCLRHVRLGPERVIGVDDWSLGSPSANPLLDLGAFAARLAGPRLPETVAGRTSYAGNFRQFLSGGLARLGLPRSLWRDVLLLAQFETAFAALERGEPDQIALLVAALGAIGSRG